MTPGASTFKKLLMEMKKEENDWIFPVKFHKIFSFVNHYNIS